MLIRGENLAITVNCGATQRHKRRKYHELPEEAQSFKENANFFLVLLCETRSELSLQQKCQVASVILLL